MSVPKKITLEFRKRTIHVEGLSSLLSSNIGRAISLRIKFMEAFYFMYHISYFNIVAPFCNCNGCISTGFHIHMTS